MKNLKEMFRMSRGTFYCILGNFFSILVFFPEIFTIHRTADEGEGYSLPLPPVSNKL